MIPLFMDWIKIAKLCVAFFTKQNYVSSITKSNSNIYLFGDGSLPITLIATLICKLYAVKFVL